MRRKLLQFPSLIAQHALRRAPKPRPQPQPQPHHHRFLHSPSARTSASPSPSPSAHLLWNRLSGATGVSLLPRTAADVAAVARTAASRWFAAARGAASLDLFSLSRRRRASGWQFSSSTFLQGAPWANWMESGDGVVWMLIGANVAVFMLWRVADPGFMRRHFMISLDNFKSGRLHTLLTSAFSHAESNHLFANMFGLYFFGNSPITVAKPCEDWGVGGWKSGDVSQGVAVRKGYQGAAATVQDEYLQGQDDQAERLQLGIVVWLPAQVARVPALVPYAAN